MKSLVIAKYTYKELIKSRIMVLSFWAALALLVIVYIASEFSYGNPQKIALDFGLGTSSLVSVAIAIFMGGNLIRKEVENRTIYISLSRPVSRFHFLLGKILGMISVLSLNVIIINCVALSIFVFYGGSIDFTIITSIIFSVIESVILLMVVIFFSLFTNQAISIVNTIVIFVLGHAIPRSFDLVVIKSNPLLLKFVKFYSYLFPNLDKLNIKDFAIYNRGLSSEFIAGGALYGIFYIIFLIVICTYLFSRKELE